MTDNPLLLALHDAPTWAHIVTVLGASGPDAWRAAEAGARRRLADLTGRQHRLRMELEETALLLDHLVRNGLQDVQTYADEFPTESSAPCILWQHASDGLQRHAPVQAMHNAVGDLRAALRDPVLFSEPPGLRRILEQNLATVLLRLAVIGASASALQESLAVASNGLAASLPGSALVPDFQHHLALGAVELAERSGAEPDYETAIAALQQVAASVPQDAPQALAASEDTANLLTTSYIRFGDAQHLGEAIDLYRKVLAHADEPRPRTLGNLAQALLREYRRTGEAGKLVEAIDCAQQAVDLTPESAPELAVRLIGLGHLLRTRHQAKIERDETHLQYAVDVHRQAFDIARNRPDDLPSRAAEALSDTLLEAATETSSPALLEEATILGRQAVSLARSQPARAQAGATLGGLLLVHHDATGDQRMLHEAIELLRSSASGTPVNDIRRPGRLANLAMGLMRQYRAEGALGTLSEARGWAEEAVRLCSDTDADRDVYYMALAAALDHSYGVSGRRADLAGVLVYRDRAVNAVPPGAPLLPVLLGSLASALLQRNDLGEFEQDLDNAVEIIEEALALAEGSDHLQLPLLLLDASDAFTRRSRRDGRTEDADRAVNLAEEAMARGQSGAADHASAKIALGRALAARFEVRGDPTDRQAALAAWRDVCQEQQASLPSATLAAATQMAQWSTAHDLQAEAAEAYATALEAERRVYRAQALREDKEAWLARTNRLFSDAAFAFVAVGDTFSASAAIERGRARLLTERLRRDEADVARLLDEGHDDLHGAFVEAVHRVNILDATPMLEPHKAQAVFDASQVARHAIAALDAAIGAVRLLPGWGSFLDSAEPPPPLWRSDGPTAPLVYVLPGDEGGLVLVIGPDGTAVLGPEDLPHLTVQTVRRKVVALLTAAEDAGRGWPDRLDETLEWLWACAVGPILELLGNQHEADFVACGLLGLLPLHAAWTQDGKGRRYAVDMLIWRYLPSGALRRSDRSLGRQSTGSLVVHSPERADAANLPGARTEARVLLRLPGGIELTGHDATAENVAEALSHADLIHFACHAHADLEHPLDSRFLLANEDLLSVRDLFRLPRRPRSLAVLSACETGLPGGPVPDEVVSLSSALLTTGTSGIVATLWQVPDAATELLMNRFYEVLTEDGTTPDVALALAQRWMRQHPAYAPDGEDSHGPAALSLSHPLNWAAFTFTGHAPSNHHFRSDT